MAIRDAPRPLLWLLAAFVILCLVYLWATPIFEASDELWHFGLVDHIARTGQLPVQDPTVETAWEQEGSQPPLYYLLAAAVVAPVDRSDIERLRQPNPHVKAGVPKASDNKNLVLHDSPHSAVRGAAAAVYVARLLSIAFGMVSVSMVYATARRIGGEGVALLAGGFTAFNPMFLFITASVNNDNLVIALNSVGIFLMVQILQEGFSTRRSISIAVVIALASLTKLSGLVLVPVVALAGLWVAYRTGQWRGVFVLGFLMLSAWLLLAGWWYARNLMLYGELFGTSMMVQVAGPRLEAFSIQTLLDEFQGFRIAYWGLFGAVNILTYDAFYVVMDALVIAALAGLGIYLWRRSQVERIVPVVLLGLIVVIGALSVIAWTAQTYASQGRLLFPFVAATSTLLALGLWQFSFIRFRAALPARIGLTGLGLFALLVPFASIVPRYTPPNPQAAVPSDIRPVYARFEDVALVGYQAQDQRYEPGDGVPVTLYWQVLEPSDQDYSLFLTLLAGSDQPIGKVDSYPGGGLLQTSGWQSGTIYADHYVIPIAADATGQGFLRMQVGWWDYPSETYIQPTGENGGPLEAVLLDIGGFIDPGAVPHLEGMTSADTVDFGGALRLLAYRADAQEVVLAWQALGILDADYTVFVQVLDEAKAIIGQGDAPPQLPTRYLRSGDQFLTRHPLHYPQPPEPGTYQIVIGWYKPDDFARLSTANPDNAYLLTTLTIP